VCHTGNGLQTACVSDLGLCLLLPASCAGCAAPTLALAVSCGPKAIKVFPLDTVVLSKLAPVTPLAVLPTLVLHCRNARRHWLPGCRLLTMGYAMTESASSLSDQCSTHEWCATPFVTIVLSLSECHWVPLSQWWSLQSLYIAPAGCAQAVDLRVSLPSALATSLLS